MVYFKTLNEQMANEIKERKKLTHVELKDGRILTTEKTPEEIFNWLKENSHIVINGEMHSKYSIISAIPQIMDDVEALIKMQPKDIQQTMRAKQRWLKSNMGKEMSLEYAQNFLANLLAKNGTQ